VNQECYNAGDCYHGECVCDRKFSGKMCQFKGLSIKFVSNAFLTISVLLSTNFGVAYLERL